MGFSPLSYILYAVSLFAQATLAFCACGSAEDVLYYSGFWRQSRQKPEYNDVFRDPQAFRTFRRRATAYVVSLTAGSFLSPASTWPVVATANDFLLYYSVMKYA
jgi:hypothetical protein